MILSEPGPNPTGPSWAVLQTQLIPARGRKRRFRWMLPPQFRHNLSPRGDGNPDTPLSKTEEGDTTYPREGTETLSAHLLSSFLKTQLIPARGRKPVLFGALHHGLGHNLSPRGDGNARNSPLIISASATQLIPARGRKPATSLYAPSFIWTQLIPARGRKLLLNATNASVSRHNLSPRGDGWAIVDIGLYYAATTKI